MNQVPSTVLSYCAAGDKTLDEERTEKSGYADLARTDNLRDLFSG